MRFERHGGPPNLEEAFTELVLNKLKGRSLDDNRNAEAAAGQFPDFGCFRDLLLIEMKHLEANQEERINEVIRQKINPDEAPIFYGRREARFVLDAVRNGDEVHAAVASKLGRTIEGLLRKANQQFLDYRQRHPRKNRVNLCIVLNSKLREFTPDMVVRAIHGRMKVGQGSEPRFRHIDAVLYISEKHFRQLPDGRPSFAVAIYEAAGAINHPWKVQVIDRVVNGWSRSRTGRPVVFDDALSDFDIVADISPTMSRSEAWELEYQRNPYLSDLSIKELRVTFHRAIALNSMTFIKGDWPKPLFEETVENLRQFQHVIAETNRRGIDMRILDKVHLSSEEILVLYADIPGILRNILLG